MYDFPLHDCTKEQNGSQFLPLFENAYGRLCQERLLRSWNFLLWKRDVTPLYSNGDNIATEKHILKYKIRKCRGLWLMN